MNLLLQIRVAAIVAANPDLDDGALVRLIASEFPPGARGWRSRAWADAARALAEFKGFKPC